MEKIVLLVLALAVFTAQCAVIKNEDAVPKRVERSPCGTCGGFGYGAYGYPPPLGPPPPPGPPLPPLFRGSRYFHTAHWTGLADNGLQPGIFSGAAAAAGDANQDAGEAFSLAGAGGISGYGGHSRIKNGGQFTLGEGHRSRSPDGYDSGAAGGSTSQSSSSSNSQAFEAGSQSSAGSDAQSSTGFGGQSQLSGGFGGQSSGGYGGQFGGQSVHGVKKVNFKESHYSYQQGGSNHGEYGGSQSGIQGSGGHKSGGFGSSESAFGRGDSASSGSTQTVD